MHLLILALENYLHRHPLVSMLSYSGGVKGIIVQNGHKSMTLGTVVANNIINDFRYLHT